KLVHLPIESLTTELLTNFPDWPLSFSPHVADVPDQQIGLGGRPLGSAVCPTHYQHVEIAGFAGGPPDLLDLLGYPSSATGRQPIFENLQRRRRPSRQEPQLVHGVDFG